VVTGSPSDLIDHLLVPAIEVTDHIARR